jgi:hypothetical protein
MSASNPSTRAYDGVLFDLLTALLDSWTLWNNVAGNEATRTSLASRISEDHLRYGRVSTV